MTVWIAVIAASLLVWALKSAGYLIPSRFMESPLMSRIAALVTVALLASLVVSQTVQSEEALTLDARLPALGVAAILFWIKTPFLLVLIAAGAVAAGLRFFGLVV